MDKNKPYIILALILFLGFYLRMYQLGKYSLWFDEAGSLLSADYMKTMISRMGIFDSIEDRYPSFLSNFFIYYWQRLGKDELTLRMSAVIFGMLSILAIYQIGKSLFGNKTGLLAAFILAISPMHIYYSREVRMYSMVALTALLSVYYFIKALRYGKLRFWFAYLVFNLLCIYVHFMTIFILLAEVIFFLIYCKKYRNLFKRWLLVHVILSLLLIPWLINALSLLRFIFTNGGKYLGIPNWAGHGTYKSIFYTLKNFSAGYNVTGAVYIPVTLIFLLLLTWGLIKKKKEERQEFWVVLFCFLIPIVSMFLISKIKVWYVDRYVLPSALFYYLLVALGLSKLRNKYLIPILCSIAILSGFGIINYYRDILPERKSCVGVGTKKDYRGASRYIMDNFQDGDVIFHVDYCSTLPFKYYFRVMGKHKSSELVAKNILLLFIKETNKVLPFEFKEQGVKNIESNISVENQKRVWFVYSSFIFDRIIKINTKKLPDELRIRNYLEKFYIKKEAKEFREIIVYLYEKR